MLTLFALLAVLGFVVLAAAMAVAFMVAVAIAAAAAAVFGVVLRIIAFGLLALLRVRRPRPDSH